MTEILEDLTLGAKGLLDQLQQGSNIAEPRNYLAAEGYRNLARANLDNAVALCSLNSCDEFRIFSALYAVRHGMELWLKSLIIDVEIDRVLVGVAGGLTVDELKDLASQARDSRDDRKRAKRGLVRSLCQFRHLALGLTYPEFRQQEIGAKFCDDAIVKLRVQGKDPRYTFAHTWAVPIAGHDLVILWERARNRFKESTYRARLYNQECLGAELLSEEQVSSGCELLGTLDPSGDAFRYPSSISGDLHRLQSVSLEALGRFASLLDNTVNVYGGALGDAYVDSILKCPHPMLD